MYDRIKDLKSLEPSTLILNNGFEDRSPRGAQLIHEHRKRFNNVMLLKYSGAENQKHYAEISRLGRVIAEHPSRYKEFDVHDAQDRSVAFKAIQELQGGVVCDITGLSRSLMLSVLTQIYWRRLTFSLVYTEAGEYYPREKDFRSLLRLRDSSEAFKNLTEYEEAEVVYSSNCRIEEIPELPGRIFPNHPVMLVAFLAFKRSRLSCILNQYETNARIFIQSIPVRADLKWRERALEIINFDLIDENKNNIVRLSTLDWHQTYSFLTELYRKDNANFRFNVLIAPLGGKMQTVGAWHFAINNPDVKVVTSTPRRHFPNKYSVDYGETHLISMDSVYDDA
jgi:hypothetical protein